jgi:hypothetical protein
MSTLQEKDWNTPYTFTLLVVKGGTHQGVWYTLHIHTAGGGRGNTLHVQTAGGEKEYTKHIHTTGSGRVTVIFTT